MVSPLQHDFNNLNALIERKEQEELDCKSRIALLDQVIMETVQPNGHLITCQLEIVQDLLTQPAETRDFTRINDTVSQKLQGIWEKQMKNFNDFFSTKNSHIENGQLFNLTYAKKEILRQQFQSSLNNSFQKFQENIRISPSTNLQILDQSLKLQKEINSKTLEQILHNKTSLITEVNNLTTQRKKLQMTLVSADADSSMNIWIACQQGDLSYLIEEFEKTDNKNSVNTPNKEGLTPLHIATLSNQLDVVEWLLKNHANPNHQNALGYQPLHDAAKMGYTLLAHTLVCNKANINGRGEYQRTPLHMAAHNGRSDIASLLIQNGADINLQTSEEDHKKTPLHDAVIRQQVQTAVILLQSPKLNVNIRDVKDFTPLYHAVIDGSLDIATFIVNHVSWKSPQDRKDPNHPSQLLTLLPKKNQIQIEQLLKRI
ncbi:ankyrin repeat domain-containing protein [Rhabdochlamydiaceae symbiont of Dictyostelium giganteum]|uniref:ankyrin repeat domain-containing protein n=1 Tax=Rhabdochlamydiaceae symbiont of Dictyostelium giganteum TaxID=3342349 RepID=UPI00385046C2